MLICGIKESNVVCNKTITMTHRSRRFAASARSPRQPPEHERAGDTDEPHDASGSADREALIGVGTQRRDRTHRADVPATR